MEEDPVDGRLALGRRLVFSAIRSRPAPIADTSMLEKLRHDDQLLPAYDSQLKALLNFLPPEMAITADIQGFSDQGTDLVVRLRVDQSVAYVGLQIKSHKELVEADLRGKLLIQHSESEDRFGEFLTWCPVLAADVSKKNRELTRRLRSIRNAFVLKPRVMVIDPGYVVTFLRMRQAQMSSLATIIARTGDPVLADAAAALLRHPIEAAILVRLVAQSLDPQGSKMTLRELELSEWLQEVSLRVPFESRYDGRRPSVALRTDVEHRTKISADDDEDYPFHDLSSPSVEAVGYLLNGPSSDAPFELLIDRLQGRLGAHLDSLLEDGSVAGSDGKYEAIIGEHPALFALAALGVVQAGLAGDELAEHVAHTALTATN